MKNGNIDEGIIEACQTLDKIVTLDLSCRGIIKYLYSSATKQVNRPLSLIASQLLLESIGLGGTVFLLSGFLVRNQFSKYIGESDGPPGIVTLAYALNKIANVIPIVVTDEPLINPMGEVFKGGGFTIVPIEYLHEAVKPTRRPTLAISIITMPTDRKDAISRANELIEQHHPGAIISCERIGANHKGILHNAQGKDVTKYHCRSDLLFKAGYEIDGNPITIGIGDGGNEIGMGNISEDLKKWLPYGDKCQCYCGDGIVPETQCDALITSTVSNWGALSLAGALTLLTGNIDVLPPVSLQKRVIESTAHAGFIDSPTGTALEIVDGIDISIHLSIANLIDQLVKSVLITKNEFWDKPR